jgi:hypothetical protein
MIVDLTELRLNALYVVGHAERLGKKAIATAATGHRAPVRHQGHTGDLL